MILGDTCTRACRFCAVNSGHPQAVCYDEPVKLAGIVRDLGLRYVVVTSVTRDDLEDEGAEQFVKIVHALRQENPGIKVELLIPDFSGKKILLERVVDAHPDVLGHNIEMAERLFPEIRPQADYRRSLNVLKMIRAMSFQMLVKSGFMVGLGETDEEVTEMMEDLHEAGCDMLTIGQYLSPSTGRRHVPVDRFVHPEVFDQYRKKALAMGFRHVFSAPLVRSSYIAEVGYQECCEK
jgi:lipoic acid synthetase